MYTCLKYLSSYRLTEDTVYLCGDSIAMRVLGINSFRLQQQSAKRETIGKDASLFVLESCYLSSSWQTPWKLNCDIFSHSKSFIRRDFIDADLHILRQVLIWTAHFILDTYEKNLPAEHTAHQPLHRADISDIGSLVKYLKQ